MKKFLRWFDQHLILVLTAFLVILIPAYPKLPLADLIEGYIVRLRFEDLAVLGANLIWLIQLLRGKVSLPKNKLSKFILAYLVIGFLSSLSAIFITQTVPFEQHHIFKLTLHYLRRIEYFSLFFLAYSAVKTRRDLTFLLIVSTVTLTGVVLYGFGQKYLLWPAFSTMNREFSKGTRLYLTPTSRVMSTFAGHYDYAAYLMMALSFLLASLWLIRKGFLRLLILVLTVATYWSLILTASRTSFIGYLTAITLIAYLLSRSRSKWRMFLNWFVTVALSLAVMLTMGDLSERFFQVLNNPDLLVHDLTQVLPIKREWINRPLAFLHRQSESLTVLKSQLHQPVATPPPSSLSTDSLVAVSSDAPPSVENPSLPPDITPEAEALRKSLEASRSATASAGSGYSPNALKYGLSIAIRLDALWPRAIAGFKRNPLLGSGYSTLVKVNNEEFTQAESTDNDYLRMLGETGLLGTVTFLGALLILAFSGYRLFRRSEHLFFQILGIGTVGVVAGLLVNATYIDVFESSKVAYLLWIFAALLIRAAELTSKPNKSSRL